MGNKLPLCELPFPNRSKQLQTVLTPEQIHLVQGSWALIKDDLEKLGLIVFYRLLEIKQQMKTMFPKIAQINHENKLETNIENEMLERHAVTVMEGLGATIESLGDSRFLNGVSIRQTHVHRQVKPQMLKKLWPSLSYGLQQVLSDNYRKSVTEAWKRVNCGFHSVTGYSKRSSENYTKSVTEDWKRVHEFICVFMKLVMENPDIDVENIDIGI